MQRRQFLQKTVAGGAFVLAARVALPPEARAAVPGWPQAPFAAATVTEALKKLYGDLPLQKDNIINIDAPYQTEDGAFVRITVQVARPDVEAISVLIEKNPAPLAAHVNLLPGSRGFFRTRIKMAESSDLKVYVKAGGKLYAGNQHIKVTVGGCGG